MGVKPPQKVYLEDGAILKFIDLTGKKFGKLTVIKRVGTNKHKRLLWFCKCDCGKTKVVQGDRLKNGKTKSCGCLRKGMHFLPLGVAMLRRAMTNYRSNAKCKGISFKLTEKQFKKIIQQDCYYCGMKPNNILRGQNNNKDLIYNGIDRIDNNKGYTINNVVPCCKLCNYRKKASTVWEFKDWIERVYNHLNKNPKNFS